MIIVDSSVWIEYFNGSDTSETGILDGLLGKRLIAIGDLILCEVLQGFGKQAEFNLAKEHLLKLQVFEMAGLDNALKSAENYRLLRRKGCTVRKTIDCLIATFVIQSGFSLLHNDRDYDPFETYLGLTVVR